MTYKLVVFDFDGTLADSLGWFIGALDELAPRHGFRRVTAAEIEMLRGRDSRAIMRYLGVPRWKLPIIAADLRRRAAAEVASIGLFDGVGHVLDALHRHGTTCGIVSSNAETTVRRVLGPERAGRIPFYECGVELFGKAKRFRRLMKRAGAIAGETIFIGDERRDIEAAQAVGAAAGAVTWGVATRELLARCTPTMMFDHPGEIVSAVAGA
jgi:phosphoglycolate phosphatase